MFQFHKGAIRTVTGASFSREQDRFNSIKVRLEPYIVKGMQLDNVFQFHKGAIRTFETAKQAAAQTSFNSIKVRLEPTADVDNYYFLMFQFHKGAIRTNKGHAGARGDVVSIP